MWERMAMTRTRVIAGDASLGNEAVSTIHAGAFGPDLPDDSVQQLRTMRARLEESVSGEDNLKRGPGGYVDIEFLAHYLAIDVLDAEQAAGRPIAEMLKALCAAGRLPAEAVEELTAALTLLRKIESRMRLFDGHAISWLPTDDEQRRLFARCCGYTDREQMDLDLHLAREQTRRWFDELLPD